VLRGADLIDIGERNRRETPSAWSLSDRSGCASCGLDLHENGRRAEARGSIPRLIKLLEEEPGSAANSCFAIAVNIPRKTKTRSKVLERRILDPVITECDPVDIRMPDEFDIAVESAHAAMVLYRHGDEFIA